uniref:Uncharacterized protein n=1 Tax=Trichuris muris TaxID=70415 RepID=A0A5S6QAH7_TRIMR
MAPIFEFQNGRAVDVASVRRHGRYSKSGPLVHPRIKGMICSTDARADKNGIGGRRRLTALIGANDRLTRADSLAAGRRFAERCLPCRFGSNRTSQTDRCFSS